MPSRAQVLVEGTALAPLARLARRVIRAVRPRSLTPLEQRAEEYDRLTVAVARRSLRGAGTCVDAGANRGDLLAAFIAASPGSRFVAFEPIPDLARGLRRRCPEAEVITTALSDSAGTATFRYLPGRPALSSLLVRPERERGQKVTELEVTLDTLDHAVADRRPIAFLKIDVEGAELALLRGARAVLREDQPVVVLECAPDHLADVAEELSANGYALWLMHEWLRDGDAVTSIDEVVVGNTEFQFVAAPSTG